MRNIVPFIILAMLSVSLGVVSAALPQYLGAKDPRVSPAESARIGDPVTATVQLLKVGPSPREANMTIHTDAVNPFFRIVIDGNEQLYTKNDVELNITVITLKNLSVEVTGRAPSVEALTELKVLDVKMYVYYDEDNKGVQELVNLPLRVSTQEIVETVRAINDAKRTYTQVEMLLNDLEAQGKNVVEFKSRLIDVKDTIRIADESQAKGATTNSKTLADQAIRELGRIKMDAEAIKPGPAPTDVKRYLTIGGAVLVALLIILFIKGRREELG